MNFLATRRSPQTSDRFGPDGSWATPFLVDPVGRRAYTGLVKQEFGDCVCSSLRATADEPGKLFVLYVVVPPLPPETKAVYVGVGFDTVVGEIPVQDGAMTPEVEPTGPILLGDGWPRIDLAAVAAAHDRERSIFDLETRVSDLARQVTTVEAADAVSLELASDVLFPIDSAQLTPAAQETITSAAATINQRARGGTISVVGHTDDTGSDAYNDTLSRQRADSVRRALEPLVTVPGVTYSVDGKGEREPVDTNATESGRRSNRRVAVTFTPKDG
ncbi:MAG: OmpA family protein, partial [Actinobacteria bacterium]|nr:OmpA family protein [Actinomycetota bacterium]